MKTCIPPEEKAKQSEQNRLQRKTRLSDESERETFSLLFPSERKLIHHHQLELENPLRRSRVARRTSSTAATVYSIRI